MLLVVLGGIVAGTLRAQPSPATTAPATQPSGQAVVVVMEGDVDNYSRDTTFKRFEEARRLGAKTVILQINTYGGLVTAGLDMSRFLRQQDDLHVVAFVHHKAISAGAMIALACDEIVMEPESQIGDCAPIAMAPGGALQPLGDAERAKAESPILEDFYASAIKNGHDPTLVEAMVSVGRAVHWVENPTTGERKFVTAADYAKLTSVDAARPAGEAVWKAVEAVRNPIDAPDTLLTLNSHLATTLGLATGTAPSAQALATERGWNVLATLAPGNGERFVQWLGGDIVRFILLNAFMLSLYISLHTPGHGGAEAVAVTSLGLLVGVPFLTGYAQWWEIAAVGIGLVLLALEIFVVPGFGVLGISGIVLMIGGLVMTFVGNAPGLPRVWSFSGTWEALQTGLVVVVSGIICSFFLSLWLRRYLPKLPYFNRLILTTSVGSTELPGEAPSGDAHDPAHAWPPVGSEGRAVTDLKPGGSVEFRDIAGNSRVVAVLSDSGYVMRGASVVVREVGGNRIVVRVVEGTDGGIEGTGGTGH
ncbi:MAG: NfeD family protein [Tepidisphaeraceae bacterium]